MTFIKHKACGKEVSAGAGDGQNENALKSRRLTIDHVIVFIVFIALFITIIDTYTSARFH